MKKVLCGSLFLCLLNLPILSQCKEVLVLTEEGNCYFLDLDCSQMEAGVEIASFCNRASRQHGKYLGYPREYYVSLLPEEKADIHFIVTTLANKSLFAIAKHRSTLEARGDRIDHIHPLNFLRTVFTDEELKVGIRNIRKKGWVWDDFIGGLKESLSTEANNNNMRQDQILDFAEAVGIDINLIYPSIYHRQWDHFVDVLIKEIPRKGNNDRYDS